MSGVINFQKKIFGYGPHGSDRSGPERRLGPNKHDAYYGNVAGEILGQKGGAKKYVRELQSQGYSLTKHPRDRKTPSAAGQLLGGG